MKKIVVIAVILVMALACEAYASPVFYTKLLAQMVRATALNLPDSISPEINDDTTWYYKGKPLRIKTNKESQVVHVGYKLFDQKIVDANGYQVFFDFLERYLLELDLQLDDKDPMIRMDIDKVVCSTGNANLFWKVTPNTSFTLEVIEKRMYRIKWTIGTELLSLTVPADCQLLLGANAIELEEIFERNLMNCKAFSYDILADEWLEGEFSQAGEFYIVNQGEYLSHQIRSDIYLKEQNGKRKLVCDLSNPQQTIRNIMLTGRYVSDIPLELTMNRYGYKATQSFVTLQQFVSYCLSEGCRLYFGVKERTSERLKGTLFALNLPLAYNHMLSIDFPLSVLEEGKGTVKGILYAYIPLQNVTEKFFIQDLSK